MIRSVLHIDAPRNEVFAILADYSRYREWFPGCERSTIVSGAGESVDAEFVINMFGKVKVGMRFKAEPARTLRFHMISGKELRSYSGSYRLTDSADGKGTVVIAELEIGLRVFVPAFIINHYAKKSMDDTGRSLKQYLRRMSLATSQGQGGNGDSLSL